MSFEDGPLDREWNPTEEEWDAMEYTGPRCSHCTEPVSAATGRQQPLYSGVWLCDGCAAAAEREWDAKHER